MIVKHVVGLGAASDVQEWAGMSAQQGSGERLQPSPRLEWAIKSGAATKKLPEGLSCAVQRQKNVPVKPW